MNSPISISEQPVGQTERLLSMAGGALLAMLALRRAPFALAALAAGAALFYRGATGSWPFSRSLGLASAEHPAAPQLQQAPSDEQVDATVEESFPASDPPGWHTGSSFTQVSE